MPDLSTVFVSLNWWQLLLGWLAIVAAGFFSGLGSSIGNTYGKRILEKMEEFLSIYKKKVGK